MGWLPDWIPGFSSKPDPTKDKTLESLDPELRDFLERESPVKYVPSPRPPNFTENLPNKDDGDPTSPPKVPKESLFPDGRYAHLWKNYRPQAELEAEAKSDQEKLADVFAGYRERKNEIGRAAIENCAFENAAVEDCYQKGTYAQQFWLCKAETRVFDKCYMTQARFLKALGFLSTYERPPEMDEAIQMHADLLYQKLLDQERQVEEAKQAGQPIPTFPPILEVRQDKRPRGFRDATVLAAMGAEGGEEVPKVLRHREMTPAQANRAAAALAKRAKVDKELPPLHPDVERRMKPEAALGLRKRMKDMSPLDREIEERATISEIEDAALTGQMIEDLRDDIRIKNREAGRGRGEFGDFLVKWFGSGSDTK